MSGAELAKNSSQIENVQRIEPARLEDVPEAMSNVVAELSAASAKRGQALHPRTAANLAELVRVMNSYYSKGRSLIALSNRCS